MENKHKKFIFLYKIPLGYISSDEISENDKKVSVKIDKILYYFRLRNFISGFITKISDRNKERVMKMLKSKENDDTTTKELKNILKPIKLKIN